MLVNVVVTVMEIAITVLVMVPGVNVIKTALVKVVIIHVLVTHVHVTVVIVAEGHCCTDTH